MSERRDEDTPDLTESLKVAFETTKQLTTLCAGSIVVIGTFLKDIFPSKNGSLAVGVGMKLLITLAFISFGLSLIVSCYGMLSYSRSLRRLELLSTPHGRERATRESRPWLYVPIPFSGGIDVPLSQLIQRSLPLPLFTAGLLSFGLAVVLNLYQ
jgi:hypothetical protein